jgi:hypothetical protein
MILQGRFILVVAIVGLLGLMGFFVYYASLDNPQLELAEIELQNVELVDVNSLESRIKLQVTFLIKNPSEKTFTVPVISYNIFANGKQIGKGAYSTEDIAMPGRAAFYPGSEIGLKNFIQINLSPEIVDEYNAIVAGEDVEYEADGLLTIETAWSIVEKEFQTYE